jgi:hypothetical protein
VHAIHGDDADWGIAEHLQAMTFDALQVANWQRSEDGSKGRNRPKPYPRPGSKRGMGTPVPDARNRLARRAPTREVGDG